MIKTTAALMIISAFTLSACTPSNPNIYQATVTRVIDGDTVVIKLPNDTTDRVRLARIDCPEVGTPGATEATAETSRMIEGQTVTINQHGHGYYGRIIARITTTQNTDLTTHLITKKLCTKK